MKVFGTLWFQFFLVAINFIIATGIFLVGGIYWYVNFIVGIGVLVVTIIFFNDDIKSLFTQQSFSNGSKNERY